MAALGDIQRRDVLTLAALGAAERAQTKVAPPVWADLPPDKAECEPGFLLGR